MKTEYEKRGGAADQGSQELISGPNPQEVLRAFAARWQSFTKYYPKAKEADFFEFLGCSKEQFVTVHYALYDELPGMKAKDIFSMGASGSPGSFFWNFKVFGREVPFLPFGQEFAGKGTTRLEAAIGGLVCLFELVAGRSERYR